MKTKLRLLPSPFSPAEERVLRRIHTSTIDWADVRTDFDDDMIDALEKLVSDGLVKKWRGTWKLAA